MLPLLRNILGRPKFKSYLVDNKYRVSLAFELHGTKYYWFDNVMEVPTGRMFSALAIYAEMEMKIDKEYLDAHTKAIELLLSPKDKKLNLQAIAQLNINMRERLELMPLPHFIYKLASVIFFDDTESPYNYDYEYNKKKIEKWEKIDSTSKDREVLDFFLKRLSVELIPSLKYQPESLKMYFPVAEQIATIHRDHLTKVLSVA